METKKLIQILKEEILKQVTPVSIFVYGSYNTPEYLPGTSDLEIGVIKQGDKSLSKILRKIAENFSNKRCKIRIYPYQLEKLKDLTVDTHFTKSVFVRHLILTANTIWGEKIMENLSLPEITLIDAYREACFSTMRALSGIFFIRTNCLNEASEMSHKACLFGTLSLEYALGEFPIGFKNIVKTSKKLNLDSEWKELINLAYAIREKRLRLSKDDLYDFNFKVVTYCNQIVETKLKKELEKGNRVLIQ